MINQIMTLIPVDNLYANNDLTREYKVSAHNISQIYSFDLCVPMFDPSDSIWERILTDLINDHRDAWEILAEM